MQGDIFVSLINNRLSPVYPCFNAEIHPFPLFPFRSSPLRKRTRNYKFPQWTDDSLMLSLSFLFLSFTISFPSDPCNLLFPLSPLPGLSRSTLTLSPSLSLSSSLSHGSSIRISSTLVFSLSLSLSYSLPRFSRSMHPAFLVVRGYLIPREWKRKREEWEANISGMYVYLTREGGGMEHVRGGKRGWRINGRTVKFWCSDNG